MKLSDLDCEMDLEAVAFDTVGILTTPATLWQRLRLWWNDWRRQRKAKCIIEIMQRYDDGRVVKLRLYDPDFEFELRAAHTEIDENMRDAPKYQPVRFEGKITGKDPVVSYL